MAKKFVTEAFSAPSVVFHKNSNSEQFENPHHHTPFYSHDEIGL